MLTDLILLYTIEHNDMATHCFPALDPNIDALP